MHLQAICAGVYEVGANHPDRLLYEDFLPLENGTTFNAYMVVGNKASALIDTVPLEKNRALVRNIKQSELCDPDYIVMLRAQENYAEPLQELSYFFPKAKVLCTAHMKELILEQVTLDEKVFMLFEDGDELDLGGKTLQFQAMEHEGSAHRRTVFLKEDKVLFSGFLFSAHYSDERVFAAFGSEELMELKRYFATQIMSKHEMVESFIDDWENREVCLVAPAHGPIWQDPGFVFQCYRNWLHKKPNKDVVIAYVSLYKHTRTLVEKLMFGLIRRGFSVIVRDIAEKPDSLLKQSTEVLVDLVQVSALFLASSTTMGEPHPAACYLATLINRMQPQTSIYGFAGSKVGKSATGERLGELLQLPRAQRLDDLFVDGKIDPDEEERIEAYMDDFAERMNALLESEKEA